MRASALSLALLMFGGSTICTAAAQQQPASIPADLAHALLAVNTNEGGRVPKIIVGQAPVGVPASLTSVDGGVVLGGLEFPEHATVVLSFTLPPNQVRAAFDKHLLAHGWTPPVLPPNAGGGFTSGEFSFGANVYCADSGMATIATVPAPGGGTYLRIQHTRNTDRSICNPRRFPMNPGMPRLHFPVLRTPPGMQQRGGGSGGNGTDHSQIETRLIGASEPLDILKDYLKQLESAGWTVGAPINADGVAAASAKTRDSDGVDWSGVMTVTRVTSGEVEVALQMMRPAER